MMVKQIQMDDVASVGSKSRELCLTDLPKVKEWVSPDALFLETHPFDLH